MFDEIDTDAVLSLDEDAQLMTDEVRTICHIFYTVNLTCD